MTLYSVYDGESNHSKSASCCVEISHKVTFAAEMTRCVSLG
jgi:hypothetical protein